MRSTLLTTAVLAASALVLTACPSADPGEPAPDWGFVSGVLATSCSPCHTSAPGFPSADPMMDFGDADAAYDLIVNYPSAEAPGVDRVEPGDSANSYLIAKLRGTHQDLGGSGARMPDGGPYVDDATIEAIADWVDAGASEETTGDDDDATGDDDDATGDDDDATGDDDDSSAGPATFAEVFTVVLDQRCSCHAGASHSTGFAFDGNQETAYGVLVDVASSEAPALDRIEPGSLADSYLWAKVTGTQADVGGSGGQMPLSGGPLNASELGLIQSWIEDGAPNN